MEYNELGIGFVDSSSVFNYNADNLSSSQRIFDSHGVYEGKEHWT